MERLKLRSNGLTVIYEHRCSEPTAVSLLIKTGAYYEKAQNSGITYCAAQAVLQDLLSKNMFSDTTCTLRRDCVIYTVSLKDTDNITNATKFLFSVFGSAPISIQAANEALSNALKKAECSTTPTDAELDEQLYFDDDTVLLPTYGTKASIKKLSADKPEKWRKKYFTPANACIVIAGNYTELELRNTISFMREFSATKSKPAEMSVFPPKQFFRTSKSDRIYTDKNKPAGLTMMFEVDLCENSTTHADMLCRILTDMLAENLRSILIAPLKSELLMYKGFAVIKVAFDVNEKDIAKSICTAADTAASLKDGANANYMDTCRDAYKTPHLYECNDNSELSVQIGLHTFILYTDSIILTEELDTDTLTEQLGDAAALIFIPDSTVLKVRCQTEQYLDNIREALIYARITLFN